jgi:hypothetical protein
MYNTSHVKRTKLRPKDPAPKLPSRMLHNPRKELSGFDILHLTQHGQGTAHSHAIRHFLHVLHKLSQTSVQNSAMLYVSYSGRIQVQKHNGKTRTRRNLLTNPIHAKHSVALRIELSCELCITPTATERNLESKHPV